MTVVSDTSPLIALSKIDQLPILGKLFREILIPPSVSDEFLRNCTASEEMAFRDACRRFIRVTKPERSFPFNRRLDAGERDALALAMEKGFAIIIDDRKGFNEAREQKLIAVSTRAVLRIAEEKNIIPNYSALERALKEKRYFPPAY
uniref:Predicted nucleic acid-binding protein, contains PIN domain n=1 Tax=Candidatus Kentrum sp. FM TaxID=2126340 RepID=A0A450U0B2_9GAMM|nr:MAG: Predicted nucleic acid-binding protein, contains PIN domain [Candidatus Kentron sp. FM]VFJ75931.1 MAG: Predicted nucleic acid-binding protein, contains PIN domain [Candidatus Kentron sp. FM]VFK21501.1 MAG: Predicted nucleic acid-binding protein, contains PIN domain [Candidatus Kentron sp. FM]